MIVRKNERPVSSTANLRGGDGEIIFTRFCKPEELPAKCRLATQITVNPGCSIGKHEHTGETEFFYIMSGEAITCDDEGNEQRVCPGDIVITGGGNSHYLKCAGDEPLEVIAFIILD